MRYISACYFSTSIIVYLTADYLSFRVSFLAVIIAVIAFFNLVHGVVERLWMISYIRRLDQYASP